ncbi:MAG: hypothetical protein QM723_31500 [Myxococcaceae bacterium]
MTIEKYAPDPNKPLGGKARGFTVTNLITYLKEKYGEAAYEEFVTTLPKSMAEPVANRQVLAVSWVPIEMYYAGIQFMVRRFHGNHPFAARQIGHDLASKDIGVIYRAALSFMTPAMIIGLSGRFWSNYFDRGALKIHKTEPGRVSGALEGWPYTDDVTANEIGGSLLAWLEHCRAKNVALVEMQVMAKDTISFNIAYQ